MTATSMVFGGRRLRRVAVIAGDGIGPAVVREALRVLVAAKATYSLAIDVEVLPYGAEHFLSTGVTIPAEELARLGRECDALFVGALGDARVPGNEHARDILLGARRTLDLYVNRRPAALLHERLSPLKSAAARAVDIVIFRENTEGAYSELGGTFKAGTPDEIAISEEINSRAGVERIVRHAFAWAAAHGRRRVTLADKANAIPAHRLWRRVFEEVGAEHPTIEREARYADALAMQLVRSPERFDVIVAGNLIGDILSDLTAGLVGGLGVAPSVNYHPGRRLALFEPVHGSAPELVGTDTANPVAAILSLALLLDHLDAPQAALAVRTAVRDAVAAEVTTPDLGGAHGTRAVGEWIAARLGGSPAQIAV
jgi:3-isopropylmalate dehydrogenase